MAKIKKTIGFFFGFPMGYLSGLFLAGSEVGQPGLINSLVFNFGNYQLHLHHWLISSMILIFFIFFLRKKFNFPALFLSISIGFLFGWMLQGIFCYSDWHKILIKK